MSPDNGLDFQEWLQTYIKGLTEVGNIDQARLTLRWITREAASLRRFIKKENSGDVASVHENDKGDNNETTETAWDDITSDDIKRLPYFTTGRETGHPTIVSEAAVRRASA